MSTLHIHNGDSTAGCLVEAGFPGRHFAFREALLEGPTPDGLEADEWHALRARFLADEYAPREDVLKDLLERDRVLDSFRDYEEVVLWFEHDLFCQINLIYLLDRFAHREMGRTRLSLICIDSFPGRKDFRGLGELTAEQLGSLYPGRQTVTEDQKRLASRAWKAYRAPSPAELEALISQDTSALPFLKNALMLHLARFPSVENGLNRIERLAVQLIWQGITDGSQLFREFGNREPIYGMGDVQFWSCLKRLNECSPALLSLSGEPPQSRSDNQFLKRPLSLTETGKAIQSQTVDFVDRCGIDRWLGGVHLTGGSIWRWDSAANSLRRPGE